MKANTEFDPISRTEDQKEEITLDPILSKIVRVSRSKDGESLFFTDYIGNTIRVRIPNSEPDSEPDKVRRNHDNKKIVLSTKRRSTCGCVPKQFCGMTILVDPNTGEPC